MSNNSKHVCQCSVLGFFDLLFSSNNNNLITIFKRLIITNQIYTEEVINY